MIVTVGIIAAIVTFALPRLNQKNTELRAIVRKVAVLSRELRAKAKLQNATYRLAIDLGEQGAMKPQQSFWVEKAQGQILNNYDPKNPPKLLDPEKKPDEDASPSPFTPDTKIMKKPEILDEEIVFSSVELSTVDEPIENGIVYIHYFPTGFADEAALHIQISKKLNWTLAIQPLTGKVDILDKFIALEDLRPQ